MKKTISILFVMFVVMVCAPAVWAQTEAQQATYQKFLDNRTTKPEVAYETAKDYLQQFAASSPADDKYVDYLRKWIVKYEKRERLQKLIGYLQANQVDEAFTAAKAVLQDYPDDGALPFDLSRAGIKAFLAGNHAHDAETLAYTKQTIQFLQSGKSFNPDQPLSEAARNETLGSMFWSVGMLTKQSAPNEAIDAFMNAAKFEGAARRNPLTYASLADIYERTYYAPPSEKYNQNCKTEEQAKTQACAEMKTQIDAAADHLVDVLARAVAYSNLPENKTQFQPYQAGWIEALTAYYKYRHANSDAGMKEYIEGVNTKPLMERMK